MNLVVMNQCVSDIARCREFAVKWYGSKAASITCASGFTTNHPGVWRHFAADVVAKDHYGRRLVPLFGLTEPSDLRIQYIEEFQQLPLPLLQMRTLNLMTMPVASTSNVQ